MSICLPVRNGERYVRESVSSVLAQTLREWELILSDNASEDGTLAAVRSFRDARLRILEQRSDVGLAANLRACLAEARGDWVLFLSHDDVLYPSCLERLLGAAGERTAFAFGGVDYVDAEGRPAGRFVPDLPERLEGDEFVRRSLGEALNPAHWAACLIRRAALEGAGGVPEGAGLFFDWGLFLRLARGSQVACVRSPLAAYRVHPESATERLAESRHARELILGLRSFAAEGAEWEGLRSKALRTLARRHARRAGGRSEGFWREARSFLTLPDLSWAARLAAVAEFGCARMRAILSGSRSRKAPSR
ncbi:MAG TPA: glycosyltransferase family 2 protein [Planctomycetota bacterium]|nr:glycosyltransferase family 2 protein [Planctomycetota bacterium]